MRLFEQRNGKGKGRVTIKAKKTKELPKDPAFKTPYTDQIFLNSNWITENFCSIFRQNWKMLILKKVF